MKTEDDQAMNLTFKAGQDPSFFMVLLRGLTHLSLYPVAFAFPVLLVRSGHLSATDAVSLSQVSFLTMGVATILLVLKPGKLGSGHLCPTNACPSFFTAALFAVKGGGLGLLSGMLIFAGIFQLILARILSRLKFLLQPEVMGVVVQMIGMTALQMTAPNRWSPCSWLPVWPRFSRRRPVSWPAGNSTAKRWMTPG